MAKRRNTPGTRQYAFEMDEHLFKQFDQFAAERGETKRQVLETALRRHMAYPPPVPKEPPLLPLPIEHSKPKKK